MESPFAIKPNTKQSQLDVDVHIDSFDVFLRTIRQLDSYTDSDDDEMDSSDDSLELERNDVDQSETNTTTENSDADERYTITKTDMDNDSPSVSRADAEHLGISGKETKEMTLTPKISLQKCNRIKEAMTKDILLAKFLCTNNQTAGPRQCGACGKVFTRKCSLLTHITSIHMAKETRCSICGRSFACQQYLDLHTKRNHTLNHDSSLDGKGTIPTKGACTKIATYYKCSVCSKQFAKEINLQLHMETHLGTQKFACDVCDAMFSRRIDVKRHKTIHTGEKPYKCDLCDKSFRMPGEVGRHKNVVHGNGNACFVCGKKYVRKDELKKHEASHFKNNKMPENVGHDFTCGVCKSVLTSQLNLNNHMKSHLSVDMTKNHYPCSHCHKSYSTTSNRAKHIHRVHNGKAYTCDTCNKQFREKTDMILHIQKVHLNLCDKHECKHCGKVFHSRSNRNKHVRIFHNTSASN